MPPRWKAEKLSILLAPKARPRTRSNQHGLADIDLRALLRTTPLGKGDHGVTYALDDDQVLKVSRIENKQQERTVRAEVALHRLVQKLTLDDGFPCVCPINAGPFLQTVEGSEYMFYSMPKLTAFRANPANFKRILKCNELFVRQGFLHNDLHQANIMMYGAKAVIIDLGLMTRYDATKIPAPLIKCLVFGQASALIDICNTNTECAAFSIVIKQLASLQTHTKKTFQLSPDDTPTSVMKKIDSKLENRTRDAICAQLLLACLCTFFEKCGHDEDLCDDLDSIGDYVYRIRNPVYYNTTIPQILARVRASWR